MESNIQSLLDKIYEDGIEKSKSESKQILTNAQEEARKIVLEATEKSQKILEKARQEVRILKESTEADLRTSLSQSIHSLKSQIIDLLVSENLDKPIHDLTSDPQFLKDLILTVTEAWIQKGISPDQIELILTKEMKSKLESELKSNIITNLEGMTIGSGEIKSGFQIVRNDKGFRLDFTEEAIKGFFQKFLRKKTAEWLFEE
jgi:V/A-type H+-transporting ATPase subunit E